MSDHGLAQQAANLEWRNAGNSGDAPDYLVSSYR